MTPEVPVSGGRKKLLIGVELIAALLAFAVPVIVDFMDPRVRSAREMEAVLGLPVTGWLPQLHAHEPVAEEVLRLAVVLRRHLGELSSGALVISALKHGTGSSTISLGIGSALDKLGIRTLVIEANPKTPDVRYIGLKARAGLAQWMSAKASLDECIEPATNTLPDRIGTGDGAQEFSLIAGGMTRLLIEEARKYYDVVLIDAAPVTNSLLTEELIREIDAVMLVSGAQADSRKEIKAAMKTIEHLRPRTFGSVLNKVAYRKGKNDSAPLLVA